VTDFRLVDNDGCAVGLDSYVHNTKRGDEKDYAFVLLTGYPDGKKMHAVGLTFAQAKNLAVFLIEELSK
jgi:hypothetical protein